jgi:hypothetical protein
MHLMAVQSMPAFSGTVSCACAWADGWGGLKHAAASGRMTFAAHLLP